MGCNRKQWYFIERKSKTKNILNGENIWSLCAQNNQIWVRSDTQGLLKFQANNNIELLKSKMEFGPKAQVIKLAQNGNL